MDRQWALLSGVPCQNRNSRAEAEVLQNNGKDNRNTLSQSVSADAGVCLHIVCMRYGNMNMRKFTKAVTVEFSET